MIRQGIAACLLLGILSGSVDAQTWPARGTRARVHLDDRGTQVTGELIEDATDGVTMSTQYGTVMRTPLSAVWRVEVSQGRVVQLRKGITIGAGVGLSVGLIKFLYDAVRDAAASPATTIGGMAVVGAVSGMLLAQAFPAEQWRELPKREWLRSGGLDLGSLARLRVTVGIRAAPGR